MTEYIYIQAKDGTPLMPTKRKRHIQKLLKKGMARVVSHKPFVVRMKYHVGKKTQPLSGGTDPGRTNIGNAVVNQNGEVVYKDHVETNNKDVPKHMSERKTHRQASRRGERLARKRLAKKHETLSKKLDNGRLLPGCEKPVDVKDIINTEARFNNRKRKEGWLTPTTRHLIDTTVNQIKYIKSILPVQNWTLELNRFAFMKMDDGTIYGVDYQNGRMKSYENVNDYIDAMQEGKCACCNSPIEHHHHIMPKNEGGSNLPENIVGLCSECHRKVHTGDISLNLIGKKKKYGALSVLNQAIPFIIKKLECLFGKENIYTCTGYETKAFRETNAIKKDHPEDAVCIAAIRKMKRIIDNTIGFEVKQFRRHNRAIINNQRERTYYLDGKMIAKNRKPRFEQKTKALSDLSLTRQEISKLVVKKSVRRYNNTKRIMPGAEFLYKGERYIITGQLSNGQYYRAYNQGNKSFPAKDCQIIKQNCGLVYL